MPLKDCLEWFPGSIAGVCGLGNMKTGGLNVARGKMELNW